ncbi:MAG TPA: phosphoribosyltransferase family protein [Dermatophilaceae bacterium]|nr:phosphoribosyltransferase family protein [Dermatophilaceae bacterium]
MVAFKNRTEAGRRLAERLTYLRGEDVVVLGLPRGGVPVAAEVAKALGAPLDVIVVRKLGVPFQPELAMGAIGEGGARVLDRRIVERAGIRPEEVRRVEEHERATLLRRAERLRHGRAPHPLTGKVAVVVDDGIATGSTARAACRVARALGAARVVLAVPVAPPEARQEISEADELVVVATPSPFFAVGNHYQDFSATTDEEVAKLLEAATTQPVPEVAPDPADVDEEVMIPVGGADVGAHLAIPQGARGIVVFAHGSGSSRHSRRNRQVAASLNQGGFGTLLLDLLTPVEALDRANVFDIPLLARRLLAATAWLDQRDDTRGALIGYFGASTGAGAALLAAADAGERVSAVVSRGGRPDLAGSRLAGVRAPTLLIVGSRDQIVLSLNRRARARLQCPSEIAVVEGATHLFEEPGALEQVAELTRDWFDHYFKTSAAHGTAGPTTKPVTGNTG